MAPTEPENKDLLKKVITVDEVTDNYEFMCKQFSLNPPCEWNALRESDEILRLLLTVYAQKDAIKRLKEIFKKETGKPAPLVMRKIEKDVSWDDCGEYNF